MQTISIDIGYGHIKYITEDGVERKFPNAIGHVTQAQGGFIPPNSYLFNGNYYYVGDQEATLKSESTATFELLCKYAPLFIYKAIIDGGLDINKPIRVATGLSVYNWRRREEFFGAIQNFTVNNNHIKLKIAQFAQGQGVFYDLFNNTSVANKNHLIIDIGYLTNDHIFFTEDRPMTTECKANQKGVIRMIHKLTIYLRDTYNFDPNPAQVNEALKTGTIVFRGEKDISDVVNKIKKQYIDDVISEIETENKEQINNAHNIIISGGGAYLFKNIEMPESFILCNPQYEFANARGYLKKLNHHPF